MKKEFIECKCRETALKHAPWATITMKVYGGFIAFENIDDYKRAKRMNNKNPENTLRLRTNSYYNG